MTSKFAKLEDRLARLEERANTSGRWLVGQIRVRDGDDTEGAIAAERVRLADLHAPIARGDRIYVIARVIVSPPDYDENDNPIPGTGSKSSTAGKAIAGHTENLSGNERRDH